MSDTSYNGWTNRETSAANLWITNDEGLYESAKERLEEYAECAGHESTEGSIGETVFCDGSCQTWERERALKEWWQELTDPREGLMSAEDILTMVRDIGDEDKINWQEIAESLLSE